jgi:L-rhamnose-H+ transport protein
MSILTGILFHFFGGFAAGSFYIPYKKVRSWSWETYWLVGGVFAWLIVPFIAALITIPEFLQIISAASLRTLGLTYMFGALWGIGAVTFGLSLRYLGMLGMSIALSLTAAFGSLAPPVWRNLFAPDSGQTFTSMLHTSGGQLSLAGVAMCLVGIAMCGRAGILRERHQSDDERRNSVPEFNVGRGLLVAVVAGMLSACFSYGIEAGHDLAMAAQHTGVNPLFRNNVTFVVVLWGGFTTNALWCLGLGMRNRTLGDYVGRQAPRLANLVFSAVAGTVWFLQFFFYGMGETRLGNGAGSWMLHMAFIIVVSNVWGLAFREWRGAGRSAMIRLGGGVTAIVVAIMLVGLGTMSG